MKHAPLFFAIIMSLAGAEAIAQGRYDSRAERERIRAEAHGWATEMQNAVGDAQQRARAAADSAGGTATIDSSNTLGGELKDPALQPAKPKMEDLVCHGVFSVGSHSLTVSDVESCSGVAGCYTVPLAGTVKHYTACEAELKTTCTSAGFSPKSVYDDSMCGV